MTKTMIGNDSASVLLQEMDTNESDWRDEGSQLVSIDEKSDEARWRNTVYECCDSALWRRRLVLTPYMLLDRLHVCRELASEAREESSCSEALQNQLDRITDEVDRLLVLLWRGGLWTDTPVQEKEACDHRTYRVIAEPFTDGKPNGRPLPLDAPPWMRELLGLDTATV